MRIVAACRRASLGRRHRQSVFHKACLRRARRLSRSRPLSVVRNLRCARGPPGKQYCANQQVNNRATHRQQILLMAMFVLELGACLDYQHTSFARPRVRARRVPAGAVRIACPCSADWRFGCRAIGASGKPEPVRVRAMAPARIAQWKERMPDNASCRRFESCSRAPGISLTS